MKKRIIIKDSSFIGPLNNVQGPILRPTLVDVGVIGRLVIEGFNVHEFVEGEYVKLDMTNFDKDLRSINETLKDNKEARGVTAPVPLKMRPVNRKIRRTNPRKILVPKEEKKIEESPKSTKKEQKHHMSNKKIEDPIIEK